MKRIPLAVFMGMGLVAGTVCAQDSTFEFSNEVKQGEQRPGFTNKVMVKTATFTVGAIAVKEEIKPHRHNDGAHVIYIVSGGGTMMHGDKSERGDLTFVDFAQPPFDPNKMEWIK